MKPQQVRDVLAWKPEGFAEQRLSAIVSLLLDTGLRYLLDGVAITRVNQVWSTDITYIRMAGGFVYLVAVMDGMADTC